MRLAAVFLVLAVIVMIPFLIWGDWFERAFTGDALQQWLASYGRAWGWLAATVLLVADLFLPVPGTPVMSGLGYIYGTWLGGLVAAGGSFLSGALAYGLCRKFGDRIAVRLMGAKGYEQGRRLFAGNSGGFVVALSRCLPLLPEAVACMAGLTKMPPARFFTALACGCLPMGFLFAWIGAAGHKEPALALWLSALIPAVLYGIALLMMKKGNQPAGMTNSETRNPKEFPNDE